MLKLEDLDKSYITGSATPEATNAIMNLFKTKLGSISDPTSTILINKALIESIEEFNTNESLPMNCRVRYIVCVGGDYLLNALHSYFISDNPNVVVVVAFDRLGGVDYEWDNSAIPNMKNANQRLSTSVINLGSISGIQFGSYDNVDCTIFDSNSVAITYAVDATDLKKKIKKFKEEIFELKSAGKYKSLITKFNYELKKLNLVTTNINFEVESYNDYTSAWKTYLTVITEIINDYDSPDGKIGIIDIKKFKYFDTDDEMVEFVGDDHVKSEKSFIISDIDTYRLIISGGTPPIV